VFSTTCKRMSSDESDLVLSDDDFVESEDDTISKKRAPTQVIGKDRNKRQKQSEELKGSSAKPAAKELREPTSSTKTKQNDMSHRVAILQASVMNVSTTGPPVSTPLESRNLVKQYLLNQNRPFSVIQIYDNLHHRVPKPQLQRGMYDSSSFLNSHCCLALDELCAPGPKCCLRVKDYGKAKIYFADQVCNTSL
jgi:hypothetical protein